MDLAEEKNGNVLWAAVAQQSHHVCRTDDDKKYTHNVHCCWTPLPFNIAVLTVALAVDHFCSSVSETVNEESSSLHWQF